MRYGRTALEARLALADLAERSLDLQYYIWDADVSGHLLADRVIRAADRGVRVRVLLDDNSIVDRDTAIAQLSAHPNIEIRAFNPFRYRGNRWQDFLTDPSRANRRSHNKLMIADSAIMIVGGRNIADHYFGVHGESNYRDLDTVAVGPVVRAAAVVFDDFWNSPFAVPYAAFVATPPTRADADAAIAKMRAQMAHERLPYPVDEEVDALTGNMKDVRDRLTWAPVRVLYDPPEKARDPSHTIFSELDALISNAQQEVLIENAYFVPRDHGVELTRALHARGVKVRVLTNSLASNDVLAVHSGYQKYRDDLLENGVEMYEVRPDSRMAQLRWSGLSWKSRAGLHAKAMVGTSWSEATISTRARPTSTRSSRCSSTVRSSPRWSPSSSRTGSSRRTATGSRWRGDGSGGRPATAGRFECTRRNPRPAGGGASKPMRWASCRFIRCCEAGRLCLLCVNFSGSSSPWRRSGAGCPRTSSVRRRARRWTRAIRRSVS
jgi:putative cardiolipin synthase